MILGPSLALGPDENTAPLVCMYRRLVVVAELSLPYRQYSRNSSQVPLLSTHLKPDTQAIPLAHQLCKCISLNGNPEKTWRSCWNSDGPSDCTESRWRVAGDSLPSGYNARLWTNLPLEKLLFPIRSNSGRCSTA